jgi:nucleoid-associated protein YgaU
MGILDKVKSAAQNTAGAAGFDATSHAELTIYHPPASAGGGLGSKITDLEFDYNPSSVQMSRSASWGAQAAVSFDRGATPEFHGAQPATMNIEVLLVGNAITGGDVTKDADRLMSCCQVDPQSVNSNRPSPPWVKLSWGALKAAQFTAVVTSVNMNYTMFSPDGTPNRAKCQLSLQEVPQATKGQNPTSGALTASRVHSVVIGDSLASLAWNEYGDPTVWRAIAQANGIDDPMRLTPGRELLLPSFEEVRR